MTAIVLEGATEQCCDLNHHCLSFFFFFNDPPPPESSPLPLPDALPICERYVRVAREVAVLDQEPTAGAQRGDQLVEDVEPLGQVLENQARVDDVEVAVEGVGADVVHADRKSTRLNSSHSQISYAVFCLK